ncbi:MAG: PAS domain-containing sensor histidine kinase [Firmicutes bacterium]|nr:PAS domain-containing sensor histidine kinase [Bacillota bacterium]
MDAMEGEGRIRLLPDLYLHNDLVLRRDAVELLEEPVFAFDGEGEPVYANASARRWLELEADETGLGSLAQRVGGHLDGAVRAALSGRSTRLIVRGGLKAQVLPLVSFDGPLAGAVLVVEAPEAPPALRRRERLFRALLDELSRGGGWAYALDAGARVAWASGELADLLGRAPQELLGRSMGELLPGLPVEARVDEEALLSRGRVERRLNLDRWLAARPGPMNVYARALLHEEEPLGVLVRMEPVRRQEEEPVAHAQQAAAIAAHEIRNALSAIRGYLQLVERSASERQQEFLRLALHELDRVSDLTSYLIALERPLTPSDQSAQPLQRCLGESVREMEVQARAAGVELRLAAPEAPVVARHSCDSLRQVMLNLIGNALEAVGPGGHVDVTLRPEGSWAVIEVADDGPGIPADRLEKIFEPFFTTKANGTGLGLSICRRLVVAQGGELRVESRDGEGAHFFVRLPLSGAEGAAAGAGRQE